MPYLDNAAVGLDEAGERLHLVAAAQVEIESKS
jgi:hypothetical protein